MPQKITKTNRTCPNCEDIKLVEVGFQDNHGLYQILETHCSIPSGGCGYSEDSEGHIRSEGNPMRKPENNSESESEGQYWDYR